MRIAPSLRDALPNDLVWIDRGGNVRPRTWRQRRAGWVVAVVVSLGFLACGALVAFADGFRVFGIVMGFVYLFIGAVAYWGVIARGALERAAQGRSREADAMADRLLAHHILAAGFLRPAHLIKARVAGKEQRWADAIEHYRAIRYLPRARRSSVLNGVTEIAVYEEIVALCNADRRDDAKDLLARAPRPTGDYLELLYDTARLVVSFALDEPNIVPSGDVEKMRRYEHHATGWGVLALVGWHARKTGNETLARRAIEAQRSKPNGDLERRLPAVARWLDQASEGLDSALPK